MHPKWWRLRRLHRAGMQPGSSRPPGSTSVGAEHCQHTAGIQAIYCFILGTLQRRALSACIVKLLPTWTNGSAGVCCLRQKPLKEDNWKGNTGDRGPPYTSGL